MFCNVNHRSFQDHERFSSTDFLFGLRSFVYLFWGKYENIVRCEKYLESLIAAVSSIKTVIDGISMLMNEVRMEQNLGNDLSVRRRIVLCDYDSAFCQSDILAHLALFQSKKVSFTI